jgi:hypothetical protein
MRETISQDIKMSNRFNDLDYIGDAVLKIIAGELQVPNPTMWKWHNNNELAKIYDNLFNMRLRNRKKRRQRKFAKSLHGDKLIVTAQMLISTHTKGSYIETWLGEEYLKNGIEGAKQMFFRMLEICNLEI